VRDENQVEKVAEKTRERVGVETTSSGTTQSFFHLTEKKVASVPSFDSSIGKVIGHTAITHHFFFVCFAFFQKKAKYKDSLSSSLVFLGF